MNSNDANIHLPTRVPGWLRGALAAGLVCGAGTAHAGEAKIGETALSWGGYVKLDVLYSRFSEGEVAQSTSRDLYVPSTIPVSMGGGESFDALDFHAKETRLFLGAKTPLENGVMLGAHIEFDFIVNQGNGTEVVTNAYNPGLRRAFITYGNWLLGQEWSTFHNMGSLPETLDFVAFPTDGTVFDRQPMVRYSSGNFSFAAENPETTINTAGTVGAKNDGRVPDLVARWVTPLDGGGNFGIAGIARQLSADDAGGLDATEMGYGVSVSGKLALGPNDDIRFQANWGDGIGRYIGLGISADAVVDGDDIEPIGIVAGYVAYRHAWNPKLRSTITASTFQADNDVVLTGDGVTKSVVSGSVNLLYSPVAKITFGAEYRHAEREIESGADGSLDRLQFSAKYVF
jgi:hypothetical protein